MPEFRYIGFTECVIEAALAHMMDRSALIFPTEKSCRYGKMIFQRNWKLLDCTFLSMEEYKAQSIYSDKVNLTDEKRLLCLFQALTDEDKHQLHIVEYPDIIDWGQHFFDFFSELAEECITPDILLTKFANNEISYQDWQLQNLSRMISIRNQYYAFISDRGYSDAIFDLNTSNLHLLPGIDNYVFINQYYYSALEKVIIAELEKTGRKVTIFWQGNVRWFDEDNLRTSEFCLEELFEKSRPHFKLTICQTSGPWQMAQAFLSDYRPVVESDVTHLIVDANFASKPYNSIFSSEYFVIPPNKPFFSTDLFVFLQCMAEGLRCISCFQGKQFIHLDWLLKAIGIKCFNEYFLANWTILQKDQLIVYLSNLAERDIIYIDLDLAILQLDDVDVPDSKILSFFDRVVTLVRNSSQVQSVTDLVELIDSANGFEISALVSDTEKKCSQILRCFYEALANFTSIDNLHLVLNWEIMYPQVSVAAGIFDLFLQFLKPKTYQVYQQETSGNRSIITNLLDTRNMSAGKVTFLNLVEGELPGQRSPVWLLNERQCREIGLKTWDDIRRWERYYFYRLITSCREVQLYTIASQENNIEPSSFIHELYQYAIDHDYPKENLWSEPEVSAKSTLQSLMFYEQLDALHDEPLVSLDQNGSFFSIPLDSDSDFHASKALRLSWSSCERFITDPFGFYIRDLKKLKPRISQVNETMSRKMFGILLHRYLMVITQRLTDQNKGLISMKWEWITTAFLQATLDSAFSAPILKYQIPHNYNWEYLCELISPFLIDTAYWFFQHELGKDSDFQNEFVTIIPETEKMTIHEKDHKILLDKDTNSLGLTVWIRGIADLRLETSAKRFIIDFKTGNSDKLQLMFYSWFYYLIEKPDLYGRIRTAFYKLMDKELIWMDYESKINPERLLEVLKTSLEKLSEAGFASATDATVKRYFINISRADLMSRIVVEEDEE